jgi:hypothetical protein
MSTIRRLYLYSVTFISLVVITWGLIGLARSAFTGDEVGDDVSRLAGALALIFVGIPVFLLHWWWAQRGADHDDEERFSYIRAVFLYGSLLATLIPVFQNLMALVNRALIIIFDTRNDRMMFGFDQTWSDNLIAIIMNSLIAAYIFSVLRKDWIAQPVNNTFAETRRLYRYIWVLYGLALMIGGIQQSLLFVFDSLEGGAIVSQAILTNGLTLILVGTPIWVFSWRIVQKAITDRTERESLLRALALFTVSLISLLVMLVSLGALLNIVIQILLGARFSIANLMGELRDPISIAIPFGLSWAYYSRIRRKDLVAMDPIPQHLNSFQQIYEYLNAFLGLFTSIVGLQMLTFFIIEILVDQPIWTEIYRERLSMAITVVIIGLPLWLINWRRTNDHKTEDGDESYQSRQSLIRKIYLYLILFVGVIGIMISAGVLIYQILQAMLGDPDDNLLRITFELVSLLILFVLVVWYHGLVLRSDGRLLALTQAEQHAEFPILVLVSELGAFSEMMVAALSKETPTMPVAVHVVELGAPDDDLSDAKAVILPANIIANPGEAIRLWLQNFSGLRFVLPTPVQGWMWVSGDSGTLPRLVQHTATMVRKLAEGEDITLTQSISPWLIFGYIMGGVLGLIFLLISASILIEFLN